MSEWEKEWEVRTRQRERVSVKEKLAVRARVSWSRVAQKVGVRNQFGVDESAERKGWKGWEQSIIIFVIFFAPSLRHVTLVSDEGVALL